MSVGFENASAASAVINMGDDQGVKRRAAFTPEQQLSVLDTLFSDKEFSAGFSKFVKDQESGSPLTYNDMDDRQLMSRLSEYLGSSVVNVNINSAEIETAQAVVAQLCMSDEELAELDTPNSARAAEAKKRKIQEDRARDFAEAEAERRLEQHRAQWDETMHKLGDKEYSGAELHAMHEWLKDEKNQEDLEDEIMARDGVSKDEAKRRRTMYQEYLTLMEKQRNNEKLTEEEKLRLQALKDNKVVQQTAAISSDLQQEGGVNAVKNKLQVEAMAGDVKNATKATVEATIENNEGKGPLFKSYASGPAIESGITSQQKFNNAASGITPVIPQPDQRPALAIAAAEPADGFGLS